MQTSAQSQYFVTVDYCINRGPACLSAKMPTTVGETPDRMCGCRNRIKAIDEHARSRARMLSGIDVHGERRIMETRLKARKPYERPTVTKLAPEQVTRQVLGHAIMGHQGAKDLLELMLPDVPAKDSKLKKNSA